MFSKFAEKVGLYDILAPISSKQRSNSDTTEDRESPCTINNNNSSPDNDNNERTKRRRLDVQLKAEKDAKARGPNFYAKKQRVRYHNKATNSVCDAYIVGVHYDDGPNHPYYTIKYKRQCEEILEDGSKRTMVREVEKQTNPDRLSRVPWDENAAWKVLQ
jgi:prolyl oligopeptidase PreP (S9A serine peptidase family)